MKTKMIFGVITASLVMTALPMWSQSRKSATPKNKPQNTVTIKTKADKFSYAVGMSIASNVKQQGIIDSLSVELMSKAFADVFSGATPLISAEESQAVIQQYMMEMQSKAGEKAAAEGRKFLEENKKKPGVITLPSGLQYLVMKEGTGEMPKETDKVTTHYHGTLINGEVFDSSVDRGQPASFPVNGVIRGWVEALQLMKVGSKWKLFVPSELAYGANGAGPKIGPNTTLIFEVELLSIDK